MYTILKGGRVFAPDELGIKDIVIAGTTVSNIGKEITPAPQYGSVKTVDVTGKYVVPGFIDQHVHLVGGGGEGGFASRTPEVLLSDVVKAGITSVVGCLGTDGTTRHMTSLLAKARGLEQEGISTYIYTGCYQVPTQTITGSVRDDIILIDKVIGCGEIAISDHRSAQPTIDDIAKLAAESRVGGMLSGKAGVLHLHIGQGKRKLTMLFELVAETEIPITQFVPTHVNRSMELLEEAVKFAKLGGIIDITANITSNLYSRAIKPSQAVRYCLEQGVSINNITLSSDGNGSMPSFDDNGQVIGLGIGKLEALYQELRTIVAEEILPLPEALKLVASNPAKMLKLPNKGCLKPGGDADIVVMDENLNIEYVFAKGHCFVEQGEVTRKGTFE